MLTMVINIGSPLYGALLFAMFAAGMVVPLVVLALLWDSTSLSEKLKPQPLTLGPITTSVWGLVSGGLFIILGILFVTTDATSSLGESLMPVNRQHWRTRSAASVNPFPTWAYCW